MAGSPLALLLPLALASVRAQAPVRPPSRVYTQDFSQSLHGATVSASSWAAARHAATKETSAVGCATRCAQLHDEDGSCNAIMFHRADGDCHLGVASLPVGGEATAYVYRIPGGAWGVWAAWGGCSKKCCGGVQNRTRTCQAKDCDGPIMEEQPCKEQDCPVNCKTIEGVDCIFPWTYDGVEYSGCITQDNYDHSYQPWCATGTACAAGDCNSYILPVGTTWSWGLCCPAPVCPCSDCAPATTTPTTGGKLTK
jgi:hypothetical protein